MRVLVAPDKFKGSLTAGEAAARMEAGWRSVLPQSHITVHPVADGGDGSLEVIASCLAFAWQSATACDPRGRSRTVRWLWDEESRDAWIEVASVAGLADLDADKRDPLTATSAGVGDVITAALNAGARRVLLCLGGSATNDAGCGMAAALGYRFLDDAGQTLDPLPVNLQHVASIERPTAPPPAGFIGLTDVQNPLLGSEGASRVYGPQKGASPADVEALEAGLAHMASIARRDLGAPDPGTPGTGAAGGLGFGIMTFLGGELSPGFDTIAGLTSLPAAVAAADLVLTGEGRLDSQTASGKAPAGVARLARRHGKPVIALAGSIPLTKVPDFDAVFPLTHEPMTMEHAMRQAGPLLEEATARLASLLLLGKNL